MEKISSTFYANLYKIASQLQANLLRTKQMYFIIATNCLSLVAGLSFNLLREQQKNYVVLSSLSLNSINELPPIIFLIGEIEEFSPEIQNNLDYYFEYIGNEDNVICSKSISNI